MLSVLAFTSCKKEGCMDPLAINYFSKVTTDDGSCSYSSSRMIGDYNFNFDTIVKQSVVYPIEKSYMKVSGGFHQNQADFHLLVNWATLNMVMPDTLLPEDLSVNGKIIDRDNFSCTLTVDKVGTTNDTIYYYNFKRF
jgi:hypothetical protein